VEWSRTVARHREFDPDEALDAALHIFWARGYDGASLSDLEYVTGVARPGLYATFGNKRALFQRALERYRTVHLSFIDEALKAPTARAVAQRLLRGAVALLNDPRTPAGCLSVNGAVACSTQGEPVRQELSAQRGAMRQALTLRLGRARDEGDLPLHVDPAALAGCLLAVVQGLILQSTDGASGTHVASVAEMALGVLPLGAP
jgi:AcrR family transcriptional regulator